MTSSAEPVTRILETSFWQQPLAERMAAFIPWREEAPLHHLGYKHPMTGESEHFYAVLRHAEVLEISRRADDFCSGQGAVSIADMPPEFLDYFGSFINMDDPRHTRQRTIVSRSFTPKRLAQVIDSVESICGEVIDAFCEAGEADFVDVLSQPLPLLVICDMMGIPRSEFKTVLDATNIILGSGDPEFLGDADPGEAVIQAGVQLIALMNELAEERKKNPTDDLTSKLVNAEVGEDMLAPNEIGPFFILLAVAGNDTTRNAISHGVNLLCQNPDQLALLRSDMDRLLPTAVEEIVRMASPVTFMRRTVTRDTELSGQKFREGEKVVMLYGAANRDPRVFDDPERFDITRDPNRHVGFGGPGPHFCLGANLARREVEVVLRHVLTRLPDLEVTGPAVPLDAVMAPPLVGGLKRLPVRFTPTERVGAR
ncbi:MAG: cytochrome P450 [Myxococcota bacterium]|nr:cytochrome P450 [Myxococcota bacterium]